MRKLTTFLLLLAMLIPTAGAQSTDVYKRQLFAVIMLGIWGTAVYSCHHYIIDVLLGISLSLIHI